MDKHKTLKDLLNTLLDSLDLSSWSICEDKLNMTVCRIKFSPRPMDSATDGNMVQTPIAYKKKSAAQQQRDRDRMGRFNRPHTRSQNKNIVEDTEIMRDTLDSDTFALSNSACLSPESMDIASPSQVAAHSPPAPLQSSPDSLSRGFFASGRGFTASWQSDGIQMVTVSEADVSLPSVSTGHISETETVELRVLSVGTDSRPSPDPPPNIDPFDKWSDGIGNPPISETELIANEVLNKRDEDITLRDVLRIMTSMHETLGNMAAIPD